jgi:uncharacterized protein involved in response to NO
MAKLIDIEEPPVATARRFALWELGFRPFYLVASAFGAASIALWALQFAGLTDRPYLDGPLWHAHEMLFGFALAVIVGFLFTAGRNWTNQPTPTGWKLGAMVALWLAARVLVLTPLHAAAAVANVAFPAAAAVLLAVPFVRARNRRNYFFVGMLAAFSVAAALVHASRLGAASMPAWVGIRVALDAVLFILAVMGGRVIPMFTNNGVKGAAASRRPGVEKAALGLLIALGVADALRLPAAAIVAISAAAAVAHAWRWALWQPWRTLKVPLVWVLHAAYAWVPVHLALRALAELDVVTSSSATHALAVGAIGGLIVGMMTRTARGHTARPLRADRVDAACYVLVLLAALVRVVVPLVAPSQTVPAVLVAAALWAAGFGTYALRYWTVLTRPRLDGRPG